MAVPRCFPADALRTCRPRCDIHNLFNAKPNLGDIGYVGYAQLNAAGGVIPQVATLQPLTATLQYTKSF